MAYKQQKLFLTVLGAAKSKIKARQTESLMRAHVSLGSEPAVFSLCARVGEGVRELSGAAFKSTGPISDGTALVT